MTKSANSFQLNVPLVGFRTWYSRPLVPQSVFSLAPSESFTPKPLALYPMTTEVAWTTGVNEATCRGANRQTSYKIPHTAPHAECYCGLHAYVSSGQNHESLWIANLFDRDLMIRGAVLMWGQIYGGVNVIRSEFAEIVGLIDESNIARLLANKYKVPCVSEDHLIYLATEHGERVNDDLMKEIEKQTEAGKKNPKDFLPTT